jgi:integrase
VRRLLASVDRGSKAGWRDLCVLHLLAYYGLRPAEVAPLRLDSIDWDAGVLHVRQRKTRSDQQLPLAAPTLRLLRQYLTFYRNQQGAVHPQLFLRARCPSGPIESTTVQDIFQKRAREAGLPHSIHVYQLRHSFAMRLLGRGVGIKAIGDVMGHRSLLSTWTYLRLDMKALRGVALPVPSERYRGQEVRHG